MTKLALETGIFGCNLMEYGMGKTAIFALINYFFAMALLVLNSNPVCGAESDEEIVGV